MSAADEVVERTVVTRLRVSRVATRIHDRMGEVGHPDEFKALLQSPEPVQGLELTLPYIDAEQTPADVAVWSMIAETPLSGPVNAAAAKKMHREAVPLRMRAALTVEGGQLGGEPPYTEVHVHPFGAVGIATAELTWEEPEPLADAWSTIADVQERAASLTIAGQTTSTTLGGAAGAAAAQVVALLCEAGGLERQEVPDYRVTTVIDGAIEPMPNAMPAYASPLHRSLHYLCGADDPPLLPEKAFLPTWAGGEFQYWEQHLAYMVDRGAALWRLSAPHGAAAPAFHAAARASHRIGRADRGLDVVVLGWAKGMGQDRSSASFAALWPYRSQVRLRAPALP
jgi:hypothetical protein